MGGAAEIAEGHTGLFCKRFEGQFQKMTIEEANRTGQGLEVAPLG